MLKHIQSSLCALVLVFALALFFPKDAFASTCVTTNDVTYYDVTVCLDAPSSNPATLTGDTSVTGSYNSLTLRNGAALKQLYFTYTPNGGSEVYLASNFKLTSGVSTGFTWHTSHYVDTTNGTLSVKALITTAGGDSYSTPATQTITLSNSVSSAPVNSNTFSPTTPNPSGNMVVAVVGDGSSDETNNVTVSNMMNGWNPDMALYLGDVYYEGGYEEFRNRYDVQFGQFANKTNPVVGNHEYLADTSATGYMWYWNNIPNYYSYDAGGWHFIALNTNYSKIQTTTSSNSTFSNGGVSGVGILTDSGKNWRINQWVNQTVTSGGETHYIASNTATTLTLKDAWTSIPSTNTSYTINGGKTTQQTWLDADLAANANKCIVAYAHHPRWSIGSHGSDTAQNEVWDSMVNNKGSLFLFGHDHSYQSWKNIGLSSPGTATASGVAELLVGTGGHGSTNIITSDSNVLASLGGSTDYGAMKLTFTKNKANYEFYTINNGSLFDSGSVPCQGAGSMSGTVTDAGTSSAIAGATVSYTGTSTTGNALTGSTTTDGSGNYSFTNIPAVDYTVTISNGTYITQNLNVSVGGASTTTQNASLVNNASITGTVTDAGTTSPVNGATVTYPGGSTTTDASGNYAIVGLGTGTAAISVSKSGYETKSANVATTTGSVVTQNFAMPAVIFSDDFESGNTSAWTTNTGSAITVQGTTYNLGTQAAEGNVASATANLRKTLASTYSNLYYRTYFYTKSQSTASGMGLLAMRTSADAAINKVYIDGPTGKLCYRNEISLTNTCSTTVPTQNAWHSVELHTIINGTSSTREVWYDGTAVSSLTSTSDSLGTNNVGRILLGESNSGRTFDVVFDDVILANAQSGVAVGSITGTVTDSLSTANVSGVTVSYSGSSTTTSAAGTYTLVNVPVGTVAVTASKTGYTTQNPNVSMNTTGTVTQNFSLAPTTGNITGTVTDAGTSAAVSGVTVSYSGGSTTTNGSGVYTITGVTPGTYDVTASKTGYTTKAASVTVTAATATTQNFALPLRIFADDFETGNMTAWTSTASMSAQTSNVHYGTYSAEGSTTGSVAVNAKKTFASSYADVYYRAYYKLVSQASGSNVSLIATRTAADGAMFKVYIDGTTNKLCMRNDITAVSTCSTTVPTANTWHSIEMHVFVNGSSASAHEVWLDGTSIATLTSSSANLGTNNTGRIYLGETTTGRTYDVIFDDVVVQNVRVGSAGGTITGTITDAQSSATLGGAGVSISSGSTTADGSGVYTLSDVAPGTYTVTASKTNYTNNTGSATVYAGSTSTVNIALTGSNIGTITGTVTDAGTSAAVSGVTVSYSGGSATTNGSGVYTLSGVASGTYTVTASKTGYTTQLASVTVTSGNTTTQNYALPLLILSEDFESGSLSYWTTNNNFSSQTTTVHAGTYAAEGNTTSAATNLRKTLSTSQPNVYLRTYFNMKSQAVGSGVGLVSMRDSSDVALIKVYIDGTTNKLCLRNEKTATNTCSTTVPTQNAWHSVELHSIINGTSSTHEVWYDGTLDTTFSSTSDDLGTTNVGRLVLGEVNTGRTFDILFDDAIAQNVSVGP